MKKIICVFIIIFADMRLEADCDNLPCETVCIELEDGATKGWREISRSVSKENGLVTLVPCDQMGDVVDKISIEYCDVSSMQGIKGFGFDLVLRVYQEKIAQLPNVISKKCLERSKNEYIDEIRLKDSDGQIIHEINRCILTDSTFHRINYSSKSMTPEMRAKWLNILRKNTEVVPYAQSVKGISVVDKFAKSVALGGYFNRWVELESHVFENGYTLANFCPIPVDDAPVMEVLEVTSVCNFGGLTLDKFYDLAKKAVSAKANSRVSFDVIESTPSERIFKYKYPLETHMLNAVARSVLTDQGYFSFTYKLALTEELPDDIAAEMVTKLKAIKIEE